MTIKLIELSKIAYDSVKQYDDEYVVKYVRFALQEHLRVNGVKFLERRKIADEIINKTVRKWIG